MTRMMMIACSALLLALSGCAQSPEPEAPGPQGPELHQAEARALPTCDGHCGRGRPCEKRCLDDDGNETTCGAYRGCPQDECQTSPPTFSAPGWAFEWEEVGFHANTSNIVGPMNWSFGDTTHCEQCGPWVGHSYSPPRTYDVVLTATVQGQLSITGGVCFDTRVSAPVPIHIVRHPPDDDPCPDGPCVPRN